jgi:hypothetical protein
MNDYLPTEFNLGQNYPNPFKDKTSIKYCVPYRTHVKLVVFDSEGKEIQKLVDEEKNAGTYEIEFKSAVSSGQSATESYYYRLEAGEYKSEKRMQIIK